MAPKGKFFHIKSKHSGLYLDIKGASKSAGTPVVLWNKNNGDNQIWYHHPLTKTIRSKLSDMCLDLNGDRLCVRPYQPGKVEQQWAFNKSRNSVDNLTRKGKVLDVVGAAKAPGTEVCSWDHHGRDNQQWELESAGSPKYFHIRSATCDKVLDISGNNKNPGAPVILYQKKGSGDNQLWFEDTFGNIRSKLNDKLVLDGSSGELKTGEYVDGKARVFWAIDGTKIVSVHNPNEVLDLKGNKTDNGTPVCVWTHHGQKNQQWHFDP